MVWVVGSFAFSVGTVVVLIAMSGLLKDQRNSFLREFPPHPVMERDTLNLIYNSYYLAGGNGHTVYLANYTTPLQVLIADLRRLDTMRVHLKVKGIMDQKFWSVRVKVDSPNFYVYDGAVPRIYRGETGHWSAERYLYDSTYFLDFVPLDSERFAIRALGYPVKENVLGRILPDVPHLRMEKGLLEKQVDGMFCTDGMMHYADDTERLVYLYHYRNEFLVMDTSLRVQYRGHTLDTISRVKFTAAVLRSGAEEVFTLSSPPYLVNRLSEVSNGLLYVNSNLLAANENQGAFDAGSVIDVYDLQDGRYVLSFYLYHFDRSVRLSEFRVFGDYLVARYEDRLVIYELTSTLFKTRDGHG